MGTYQSDSQGDVLTGQEIDIDEPRMFKVLLHNDNYTTMDFVLYVLETVFYKSPADATRIMLNVHRNGVGECGIYPFDVAESKVDQVHHLAQEHKYPLKSSMEEV